MDSATRNEVLLVGRLAAEPVELQLPSGDLLSTFRLIVERPPARRTTPRAQTVDTIDCVVWTAGLRRTAGGWCSGDTLELQGSLRRRFFKTPRGASSRYEVEVSRAKRVARAA